MFKIVAFDMDGTQTGNVTSSQTQSFSPCIIKKKQKEFYHGKKESVCQYPGMCCLRMLHKSLSAKCDHRSPRHPCGH